MKSTTYRARRYFVPSSLPASQTTDRAARARRRAVQAKPLTYSDLLEKQAYFVSTKQVNGQTAANRATVLRAFLRANHLSEADVVGDEMRARFPDCLRTYIDVLRDAGQKQRRITNDKAALSPWKQMVLEWDTAQAINNEKPTPFRAQLVELVRGFSIKRVAKECGVPYDMLLGWMNGKVPRQSSARFIARVEAFFGMERGALLALTGFSHMPRLYPSLGEPAKIEYRQTLSARTQDHYWLRVSEDSPLRKQWNDFAEYKTAAVPLLERSSKGQWRYSPLPFERNTPANWFAFHNGKEVPSAKAAWAKVGGYLGWLTLPPDRGGAGISFDAAQTLAWLVVPELLQRHVEWRRKRTGGKLTTSIPEMLGWLQSLMRAEVGYFPQSPWLRETLPQQYRTDDWDAMCAKQMKFCRRLVQSMKGDIELSRDPFAPIEHIVDLDEPMEAVADMVQRMRADRPIGNEMDEAVWGRDLLLIKLLASNPLRVRQFAHMTWRPDNTGNLYQKVDGSWHIHWGGRYFKNYKFAAADLDYDSPVHPAVWADLEAYLYKYRPRLMRHETSILFLVGRSCRLSQKAIETQTFHTPWRELSRRVEEKTRRYLWRCPGVGAHAMRHLTGTSIVKAAPGDYDTAAKVLNDRPLTVQRHYGRFTSGDGAKRMGELLGKAFRRM